MLRDVDDETIPPPTTTTPPPMINIKVDWIIKEYIKRAATRRAGAGRAGTGRAGTGRIETVLLLLHAYAIPAVGRVSFLNSLVQMCIYIYIMSVTTIPPALWAEVV